MKFLFFLLSFSLAAQTTTKSFWVTSGPKIPTTTDTKAVNLGVKFKVLVPGTITALKFYKGTGNNGPHTVTLWQGGTKLVSVTTSSETASGWQTVTIPPLLIAANTEYTASYLASKGHYADDQTYNWAGLRSSPLVISGSSPGVFVYSSSVTLPTETWNGSNYWVDVIFKYSTSSTPVPHSVTLSWTASVPSNIQGYNIYRSNVSGSGFSKINSVLIAGTAYVDKNVAAGQKYFYVATAVDNTGAESGYSSQATAIIPTP
jgi:hypothetical protein